MCLCWATHPAWKPLSYSISKRGLCFSWTLYPDKALASEIEREWARHEAEQAADTSQTSSQPDQACRSHQETRSLWQMSESPLRWPWGSPQSQCVSKPSLCPVERTIHFSGPGKDLDSYNFKGNSGSGPRTECVLWFKSTGFRASPTWVWSVAGPLLKHSFPHL